MKRELAIHFSFWFLYFVFLSLLKHYLDISYWPFWVGGLVGVLLPDIDHLIYAYFLKPQELTSQRIGFLVDHKEFWRTIQLIYETRVERKNLIFHTVFFQIIFFVLTFLVLSSSSSLIGRGLVISFSVHLIVDEFIDLHALKSFDNWMNLLPISLDLKQAKIYLSIIIFLVCITSILM